MKIPITIPDDCVEEVETYCQKHSNMSFQERVQQEADKIIDNTNDLSLSMEKATVAINAFREAIKRKD